MGSRNRRSCVIAGSVQQTFPVLLCQVVFTATGMAVCPPAIAVMHAAASAASGPTEADWVRWTGMAVGVAGALVVAPRAPGHICRAAVKWGQRTARKVFGKRPVRHQTSAHQGIHGEGSVNGEGVKGPPLNPSTEQLMEYLLEQVAKNRDQIRALERKQERDHGAVTQEVAELTAELRRSDQALRRLREQDKAEDDQVDARGLPLIALGIILTVIPDGLADVVPGLGVALIVVSWLLILGLAVVPFTKWAWPWVVRALTVAWRWLAASPAALRSKLDDWRAARAQ